MVTRLSLCDRDAAPWANSVLVQRQHAARPHSAHLSLSSAAAAPWLLPSRPRRLAARSAREGEEWTLLSETAVAVVIQEP